MPVEIRGSFDRSGCSISESDVQPTDQAVNNGVNVALDQSQFDTLVSFTFNVGVASFMGSTLLKLFSTRDSTRSRFSCDAGTRRAAKVVQGLVNRRENEIKLWNGQV